MDPELEARMIAIFRSTGKFRFRRQFRRENGVGTSKNQKILGPCAGPGGGQTAAARWPGAHHRSKNLRAGQADATGSRLLPGEKIRGIALKMQGLVRDHGGRILRLGQSLGRLLSRH